MKQLLVFKSVTCAPCNALSNVMKTAELNVDQITTVDVTGNRDIAIEYNIRQVPTCVILQDGKEIKRNVGTMTAAKLEEFVNS